MRLKLNNFNERENKLRKTETMPDNLAFEVELMVFVTNDPNPMPSEIDGFLGISPCPPGLEETEYGFGTQLLKYYKNSSKFAHLVEG